LHFYILLLLFLLLPVYLSLPVLQLLLSVASGDNICSSLCLLRNAKTMIVSVFTSLHLVHR
jgi:hypothetical protein